VYYLVIIYYLLDIIEDRTKNKKWSNNRFSNSLKRSGNKFNTKSYNFLIEKIILFIIYYLLFIIYYLLFIIYYLLFIINYLLIIIYYLLFIIY